MDNNQKIIIAITGTLGSGKGTVVEFLKQKGFKHYSVRSFLMQEIEKRGMSVTVDSMYKLANELRKENSPSYIIEELYKQAEKEDCNTIIESIRNPGEIEALRNKNNFYLIAVDANQKIRWQRIVKRKGDVSDDISFEKFKFEEKRQMQSDNPNEQNLSKCIEMADFKLDNSESLERFKEKIIKVLEKIYEDKD